MARGQEGAHLVLPHRRSTPQLAAAAGHRSLAPHPARVSDTSDDTDGPPNRDALHRQPAMPMRPRRPLAQASLAEPTDREDADTGFLAAPARGPRASASDAFVPRDRDLAALEAAARTCRACPLWEPATQTVFGEGPLHAAMVLVGEQPGDEEDRAGRPFVGPAGRVLDEALARAGVARTEVYVTNAVKHFKFELRGKRRLHARPSQGEVNACHGWLDAEIEAVQPRVVVCLGATAAQSFQGRSFSLTRNRGRVIGAGSARAWLATWHPSAILRVPDRAAAMRMREELVADLALARRAIPQAG